MHQIKIDYHVIKQVIQHKASFANNQAKYILSIIEHIFLSL